MNRRVGQRVVAAGAAVGAIVSLSACEWIFSLNVASDASPSSEAGTEARADVVDAGFADVEASAPKYCDTIADASFCWSFDEPGFLPPPSTKLQTVSNSDSLQPLEGDGAKTPPASLILFVASQETAPSGIFHAQAAMRSHVACNFDMNVASIGADANPIYVAELETPNPDGGLPLFTARIAVNPLPVSSFDINLEVTQASGAPSTRNIGQNITRLWFHVTLEVDVESDLKATATIPEVNGSATQPLDGSTPALVSAFYVGAAPVSATPGTWKLNFDDIYCTGF